MTPAQRRTQALDRLLELVVTVSADMEQELGATDLTPARAHVVWHLVHHGPSTQRDLADALEVSARNVTGLVDGLAATGFVTREPHPTDRRATLVTLTERGARTAASLQGGQQEFADLLFRRMPRARLDGFVEAADDLLARMRAAGVGRGA